MGLIFRPFRAKLNYIDLHLASQDVDLDRPFRAKVCFFNSFFSDMNGINISPIQGYAELYRIAS